MSPVGSTTLLPWRLRVERVPLSRRERLRAWWFWVLDALSETPPRERARQVKVMPGEPGFEKAWPMESVVTWCSGTYSISVDRAKSDRETGKEETR